MRIARFARTIVSQMFLIAAGAIAQTAQFSTPASASLEYCGGVHKSGDKITCYVTFAQDVDLTSVELSFLNKTLIRPSERGKVQDVHLSDTRKINGRTFSVSGKVGDCGAGMYRPHRVVVTSGLKGSRTYKVDKLEGVVLEIVSSGQEQPANEAVKTPLKVTDVFERNPNECSGQHKAGDRLTCYVKFDRPSEASRLSLSFVHDMQPEQQAFALRWVYVKRIDDFTYELDGAIDQCASGDYTLQALYKEGSGSFTEGRDFDGKLRLKVESSFTCVRRPGNSIGFTPDRVECGGTYRSGETIRCDVTFDTAASIESVSMLRFYRIQRDYNVDESSGLCTEFSLTAVERIDERTHRFAGIAPWCALGTYRPDLFIDNHTFIKVRGQIELENSVSIFPDIKAITAVPPATN